jgi:hypothetical protein
MLKVVLQLAFQQQIVMHNRVHAKLNSFKRFIHRKENKNFKDSSIQCKKYD